MENFYSVQIVKMFLNGLRNTLDIDYIEEQNKYLTGKRVKVIIDS